LKLKQLLLKGLVISLRTLTLSLLGLLVGCGLPKNDEAPSPTNAIIGGIEVSERDRTIQNITSSIVAVYDEETGEFCTGTLVAPNIVLTAAHCIDTDTRSLQIIFGQNVRLNYRNRLPVDKVEVSPYWSSWRHEEKNLADIALVRFVGNTPAGYRPAKILKTLEVLTRDARVVIGGYGISDATKDSGGGVLRLAQLRINDGAFSESEATVDQRHNTGACRGDSGGPAFIEINKQLYLWGLVGRGVEDHQRACDKFAAITKVSFHQTWMNRMIERLSPSRNSWGLRQ
jgi:secreted trypsin-like serine protease